MKNSYKKWIIGLSSVFLFGAGFYLVESNTPSKVAQAAENPVSYALAFNEYTLSEYDATTTVLDPFGAKVEVKDGSFVPVKEGEYLIKRGGTTNVLKVFLSVPVSDYNFEFELNDEYKTYEMIQLPSVVISSAITEEASYGIYVEKDGVLQKKLGVEETYFQPTASGEYSIIYTYVDYFGYISNDRFTFTVVDAPVIAFNPPDSLQYGESIAMDKVYAYCGQEQTLVDIRVYAPDGNPLDISSGAFIVNQAGEYRFEFSANVDGKDVNASYVATCDVYTDGQFISVRMASEPKNNVAVSKDFIHEGEKGVLLQANVTGGIYQFKNVVNLNAITREQNILSFAPYFGDGQGYADDIIVKLTDVYDKYNSVSIQFKRSPFHKDYTYVTAEYAGRHYAYDNENWVLTGVNGPVKIGDKYFFGGIMPQNWSLVGEHQFGSKFDMYSFTMDYAERQMVLDLTSVGQGRYTLCDYDNPVWVGGEEYTWRGFTTGEAYLSIEFGTITGNGAAIVVTEVMGQKLNGEVVADVTPPSFIFDVDDAHLQNMPYGVVGKEYVLPSAKALDVVCGEVETVRTLWKNGVEIPVDDQFIPDGEGEYTVRYETIDLKGNPEKKELTFMVYTQDTKPTIALNMGEYITPATGSYFALPQIAVDGVSGAYKIETSIFYNGVEVVPDEANRIYIDRNGKITLKATLTDWLGQKAEEDFEIPVATEDISFVIPNRFGVVQAGRTLEFTDAIVYDFEKSGQQVVQKIFVNDQELADNRYTVQSSDTKLSIRYEITCGGKSESQSYEVPVYTAISDLFVTDAQYVVGGKNNDEARFNFTQNGTVALVNAVSHNHLKISVAVTDLNASENFYLDLKLQGATYGRESVFVRVRKQDNAQVALQLNGEGASYLIDGSFTTGTPFTFLYDCERHIFKEEVNENQIFSIDRCENGDVFHGFTGGAAYFSIAVGGMITGDSAQIRLAAISNETFAANYNTGKDIIAPVVSIPVNTETLTYTLGDKYLLSPAKAYDVVQGAFDAKVTLIAPDGTTVFSKVLAEDYLLSLDSYGRYTVYYETTEPLFTVKGSREVYLNVVDSESPTISLKGEIIKTATLGDSYTVVGGTVLDNVDENVALHIAIYDPLYRNTYVKEGDVYRFVVKGTHKIVYFATDKAGNTQRTTHYIEVN